VNRLELRERILDCTACELHAISSGPVPFSGPSPAQFAIVGEAPGTEEDKGGEPFLGRAGQLLRHHLAEAGLDPARAFICNTVSCYPTGTPRPGSIAACRQNLVDQLALAQVTMILALGSVALKSFRSDLHITMAHGQTFALRDGRTVFTTFHPAAALRRTDWDEAMVTDLHRFGAAVKAGGWTGLTIELCAYCRKPEAAMTEIRFDQAGLPFCEKCWPTSPGAVEAPRTVDEAVAMVVEAFPGAEVG
jgi:uracil-DNA glycosylase